MNRFSVALAMVCSIVCLKTVATHIEWPAISSPLYLLFGLLAILLVGIAATLWHLLAFNDEPPRP